VTRHNAALVEEVSAKAPGGAVIGTIVLWRCVARAGRIENIHYAACGIFAFIANRSEPPLLTETGLSSRIIRRRNRIHLLRTT
jgi:hypothetical protein